MQSDTEDIITNDINNLQNELNNDLSKAESLLKLKSYLNCSTDTIIEFEKLSVSDLNTILKKSSS